MRRVAALLAAALLGAVLAGCGGGGAEPGAPKGATLVLDFQPNAVHSGIYAAQANGYFRDAGLDLTIQEPSSTADSAKLLETGRADFAVMDINDFGIARERGLDLVAIAAIVQRPLASVIARDPAQIRTPADLAGKTIGVTGVPSDDAVLDTVLRSGGVDPSDVHPVTIGFNAVAELAAGKIDAATAFWNAEGVQLQQMGIPIREFRVDSGRRGIRRWWSQRLRSDSSRKASRVHSLTRSAAGITNSIRTRLERSTISCRRCRGWTNPPRKLSLRRWRMPMHFRPGSDPPSRRGRERH
jgi:putative hydroxymethylpyrimidine transport system substrate-binding protein